MANTENTGSSLKISEEVLAKIVSVALSETAGVTGAVPKNGEALMDKINRKLPSRGIRIEYKEDEVVINASISVAYGCNLQEIGSAAQDNIYHAIENMTGLKVSAVNITISGITFDEAKKIEQ